MKSGNKTLLILGVVVLTLSASYMGVQLVDAFRTFQVEDHISDTFWPVARAIEAYYTKNGSVPPSLGSLIPTYLQEIPRSPYADSIVYTALPNNNWILNIHSATLKPSRSYSWRTSQEFTDEERARLMKEFHLIAVLRDK